MSDSRIALIAGITGRARSDLAAKPRVAAAFERHFSIRNGMAASAAGEAVPADQR